ncbi:protein escargot-like [Anopheles stephensi]|uniref:protein escargot-like n=1 Tax=Anopheles stephensi TaxID=30069 RepID=UPI0007D312F0|nr:protein escargot-like [Anopheles stephensi]
MPTSIMQKNYSNCPLKKRPVFMSKEDALKNDSDGEMEPENLSTKPQDLSMKSMKKKARSESPEQLVVIKAEDTLPTPPPSSSPAPSDTKSPLSIPTPTYGSLPSMYYAGSRSPASFPSVYPGFPYPLPYPADFYSAYHHQQSQQTTPHHPAGLPLHHHHSHHLHPHHSQISPPRSEPLSPYSAGQHDTSGSPSASPTHLFRPDRHSLSPPPSMVVPAYPAELRLNQNNNIIKSESAFVRAQHRYMPYPLHHPAAHHHHHHHLMMSSVADHPSLSPASSHTSFNSYLSSRGRSLSPISSSAPASPGADSEENNNSLSVTNGNSTSLSSSSGCSSILTEKSTSSSNIQKKGEGEKGAATPASGGAPRYQCPDCGKSYSTYSGLSKHQQFHCPAAEGNQAQKTFVCKECDKPYKTLGALKMHIRTHTLPCKCTHCDKAFSRPWLLQGHIRTHTGEKPFVCKLCSRAFADRSNLRAHQQTHEDVKRFKCPTCTKSFSRLPLLTKHAESGCPGGSGGSSTAGSPVPSLARSDSPHSQSGASCNISEDSFIPTVLPHGGNIAVY